MKKLLKSIIITLAVIFAVSPFLCSGDVSNSINAPVEQQNFAGFNFSHDNLCTAQQLQEETHENSSTLSTIDSRIGTLSKTIMFKKEEVKALCEKLDSLQFNLSTRHDNDKLIEEGIQLVSQLNALETEIDKLYAALDSIKKQ